MTDESLDTGALGDDQEDLQQDELTSLKARADVMGITYKSNIGAEALKAKIAAHLSPVPDAVDEPKAPTTGATGSVVQSAAAIAVQKRKDANVLVRCRIQSMDPKKKEWEGELFTVSNALVGTQKRFIPFNQDWHIPRMMFNVIKEREFQDFYTATENGRKVRRGKVVREFAIEMLDPLTGEQLKDLAQRQAMAGGTSD